MTACRSPERPGPRYVAADRVHPTAAGQLAFADAAAWRLKDRGWDLPLPSSLAPAADPPTWGERRAWAAHTARFMLEAPARQLVRTLR